MPKKSGPVPVTLDRDKAQSLAACGATNEQIAAGLGVSSGTLFNCRKRDKALDEAIAQGKDKADLQVVGSLYKKAMGGDTTACIFWLKNRRPAEWRDRHEQAVTGEQGAAIRIEVIHLKGEGGNGNGNGNGNGHGEGK